MTSSWQNLLKQQSSSSDEFDLEAHNYFTPLDQMGVLQVTGDDALSFLQNLLTNDVAALTVNQAQRSGFCNAKGRLFALFLLIRSADSYQLILPRSMCDVLQQRLTMYILRSKVTITNESDAVFCIGSMVARSDKTKLSKHISLPNDHKRFVTLCKLEDLEILLNNFEQQGFKLAPTNTWNNLDIAAGLPMIWPESKEKFTPQQLNLDVIGGVSFSKGCYPGQEVVARLHYLGKPSRRLFIAEAETTQIPIVADEVTTKEGAIAGHITSAQVGEGKVKLLVSLKLATASTPLFINSTTPIKVQDSDTLNGSD